MAKKKKSRNNLKKVITRLEELDDYVTKVGFDPSKHHPRSGTSAIDVARINYYGGDHPDTGRPFPPARPFMDVAFSNAELEVAEVLKKGISQIIKGIKSPRQVMRLLGNAQKRHLMYVLRNGHLYFEQNAGSTIRKKGFDKALFETGIFLSRAIKVDVSNG